MQIKSTFFSLYPQHEHNKKRTLMTLSYMKLEELKVYGIDFELSFESLKSIKSY